MEVIIFWCLEGANLAQADYFHRNLPASPAQMVINPSPVHGRKRWQSRFTFFLLLCLIKLFNLRRECSEASWLFRCNISFLFSRLPFPRSFRVPRKEFLYASLCLMWRWMSFFRVLCERVGWEKEVAEIFAWVLKVFFNGGVYEWCHVVMKNSWYPRGWP